MTRTLPKPCRTQKHGRQPKFEPPPYPHSNETIERDHARLHPYGIRRRVQIHHGLSTRLEIRASVKRTLRTQTSNARIAESVWFESRPYPAAPPLGNTSLTVHLEEGIAGRSAARTRDCVVVFAEGVFGANMTAKVCSSSWRAGRPVSAVRMAVSSGARARPS